jgi:hypothetical protein
MIVSDINKTLLNKTLFRRKYKHQDDLIILHPLTKTGYTILNKYSDDFNLYDISEFIYVHNQIHNYKILYNERNLDYIEDVVDTQVSMILTEIHPKLFNSFRSIIIVRDPRVLYVLNDYDLFDKYIFIYFINSFLKLYFDYIENSEFEPLVIKYEDIISQPNFVSSQLSMYLHRPIHLNIPNDFKVNTYFSEIDLQNSYCLREPNVENYNFIHDNKYEFRNQFGYGSANLPLDQLFCT